MIKKLLSTLTAVALVAMPLVILSGCEDKIEHIEEKETVHETAPQPVSPGKMVVE